ncbi:MAG: hypothetical protein FJX42_03760 [Alphaproteobacteria bacterium]|nr:hypothetical protein [Alphaproteobacteria bacterium]
MTGKKPAPAKPDKTLAAQARERRLAQALKANLRKRKDQARARSEPSDTPESRPQLEKPEKNPLGRTVIGPNTPSPSFE